MQVNILDVAIRMIEDVNMSINDLCPPPYEYPSTEGRVAQIIVDTLDRLKTIKKNDNLTK